MEPQQTQQLDDFSTTGCRVLLVDDDQSLLEILARVLRRAGHEVVACHLFEAAKRALAEAPPDILITDVRLGAYNGMQLLVRAKLNRPTMQAIVFTGFDDPVIRQDALSLGAAYVVKPVDTHELLRRIQRPT